MIRLHLRCLFNAAILIASTAALAQQYTIKKIVFNGTVPYSQAALEAASGLKPGDTITKPNLQAAAQRLVDTGAFADLQSSLDGPYKTVSVIFAIEPVDPARLLTAGFENFVWYTPEELAAELRKRVPLFNGAVPEAGNLQDAITAALQQMLSEKGIAAKVSEEPFAPSANQPLRVAEYRVDTPSVRVHSVTLTGVTGAFASPTAKVVASLNGSRYNEGLAPGSLTYRLLSPCRDAGYQAASLSSFTRTIASSTGTNVDVDIAATVTPGDVYTLSKLDWPGSPILSAANFNLSTNFKPGAVASQKSLLESLRVLEAAYRNKGYVDVAVTAEPKLDTATHQVSFTIAAIAGAQYTLKSVTPINLNDAQKKDFERGWILHPGDIYNEGYVTSFLKNNNALQSFNGYAASFKTVADPDAHTVDLTVDFVRSAR